MLRELEKLLTELARQQGIDIPAKDSPRKHPQRQTMRRPQPEPELVEVIEAESIHEDIDQHVARTVDTSDITSNASRLGAEVDQSDDRLEARIHSKFDHDLGRLHADDSADSPESADVSSMADEIAEMLRNPKSIRQAIVLNEIFSRPAERW
jgi:hypothetical protein